jgi:putative ABC transport system permease protein
VGIVFDLSAAARGLARRPGTTAVLVGTLALGLGANTAAFSIVDAVLLRPVPFGPHTGRVVSLHSLHPSRTAQLDDAGLSYAELLAVRAGAPGLERAGGFVGRNFALDDVLGTERVRGGSVTADLFEAIGARPLLGRAFDAEEGRAMGFESVVLLGHGLWQRRFGGDPGIVGRTLGLNGRRLTVVGVMPPGFAFPEREELWLPWRPDGEGDPAARVLLAVAVRKPGATPAAVAAELEAVSARLEERHGEASRGFRLKAVPFREAALGPGTATGVVTLLAALTLVLLVACANLGGMLLARALDRRREFAVKAALGASQGRLVRGQLAEVFVLSVAGGLLGWMVAAWAVPALVAAFPEPPPYWMRFEVSGRALLHALALTGLTTLAAGLVPALRASAPDPVRDLKEGGQGAAAGRRTRLAQDGLAAAQVAVCLALVVGADLLVRSFRNLQAASAGVREEGLLTFRAYLAGDELDLPEAKARALERLVRELEAEPGVERAGITTAIPADDGGPTVAVVRDGAGGRPEDEILATLLGASPGLFETLGAGLLRGRAFDAREFEDPRAGSAIVSAALARRLQPGGDVVGRRFGLSQGGRLEWWTAVGVAPDVQYEEFGEETPASRLAVYVPYARLGWRTVAVMARTASDPSALARDLSRTARRAHPGLAPYEVRTMKEVRAGTTWEQRFLGRTMGGLASAALLLAGVGLYGLLRHFVAARTHEIGLRLALGASSMQAARLVLSRAARAYLAGLAGGALLAVVLTRALSGLLFAVGPANPRTALVAAACLGLLLAGAAWSPVRRAARIDPMAALRCE